MSSGRDAAMTDRPATIPSVAIGFAERRICTVLFCDVAGSTTLAESRDPEEWADLMSGAFAALVPAITRYEGTVARLLGDAVLAYFGAPIAHEDDPQRAILAAFAMIEAIHRYRGGLADATLAGLDVRIGINTGLVVVQDIRAGAAIEYTALGDVVNVAARLQGVAATGSVVVSEATHGLVAGSFDFRPLGDLALKGRAGAVAAFEVTGRAADRHERGPERRHAPLVGRDRELAALRAAATAARRGEGSVIAIAGEAGLGKSRLLGELRAYWHASAAMGQEHWSESRGESFARSQPYHLLQPHILEMCDAGEGEDPAVVREKLAHGDRGCCAAGCSIATAISEGPPEQRDRALVALNEILAVGVPDPAAAASTDVPREEIVRLVRGITERHIAGGVGAFAFDDVQWSDAASADVIVELGDLARSQAMLIIIAFRPDRDSAATPLRDALAARCGDRYRMLELAPLSAEDSAAAARTLLPADASEAQLSTLLGKADGNPFFIEELAALVDHEHGVPGTLQLAIAAQVDRLGEVARRVLQAAAVAGRTVAEPVLRRLIVGEPDASAALDRVIRSGFLREEGMRGEIRYVFRHTLAQEAVYAMLAQRARRALHRRVADAMIELAGSRDDQAAVVAHHLVAAADPAAVGWLVRAGEYAMRLHAIDDALALYDEAIARSGPATSPEAFAEIQLKRGRALELRSDFGHALAAYEDLALRARDSGAAALEANALSRMATVLNMPSALHDPARAGTLLDRAAELARAGGDRLLLADIEWNRMLRDQWTGNWSSAEAAGRSAIAVFRELGVTERLAMALNTMSHVYRETDRFDQALRTMEEATALFRSIGNVPMTIDSLGITAFTSMLLGRNDEMLRVGTEARRLSDEIQHDFGRADTTFYLAYARREAGDLGAAIDVFEQTIEYAKRSGHVGALVSVAPLLAMAYRDAGALDHALNRLDAAETLATEHMDQWLGWVMVSRARVLVARGELNAARGLIARSEEHTAYFLRLPAELFTALAAVELDLAAGDAPLAVERARRESARLRAIGAGIYLTDLEWLEGEALLVAGDEAAARVALERALGTADRLGTGRVRWRIEVALAATLERSGDQERATRLRADAAAFTREVERGLEPRGLAASFAALPEVRAARASQQPV